MTRVYTLVNQKGGVGKTGHRGGPGLGACPLGRKGFDDRWDPQGNLSLHFGAVDQERDLGHL